VILCLAIIGTIPAVTDRQRDKQSHRIHRANIALRGKSCTVGCISVVFNFSPSYNFSVFNKKTVIWQTECIVLCRLLQLYPYQSVTVCVCKLHCDFSIVECISQSCINIKPQAISCKQHQVGHSLALWPCGILKSEPRHVTSRTETRHRASTSTSAQQCTTTGHPYHSPNLHPGPCSV